MNNDSMNDSMLVKLDDPVSIVYCHDPIHPDDRETIVLPCGPGQMLIDYLDASGFLYDEGFVVSINGAEIASEDWAVTDAVAGDCIVIMPRIGAPLIPLIGMAAAFGVAQIGLTGIYLFAAQTAILLGSAVLMNALMPPPPKMDGENDGSVYSWGQIGNADIQGPVLPMLWGTHRVTGRTIQQYVSSVSDKQYLNLLVAVCEGPITSFADCKINGQLATSYRDVAVTTRVGTLYETVIDGFDQVITQHGYADRILFIGTGLTGIEDAASRPNAVIRTTDGNQVNAIEVEVGFPGGCYKIDHDGDNENLTINFCCGYRVHPSGGWVGPYGITVTGNGDNPVYGTHKMEGLPASSYDVLVYRTDYDNDGAAYQVDSYLTAIREFVDEEIQYRGVAKYAIQALATDQLSGGRPKTTIIATRSWVWVYDEDIAAWSQKPATNPAWAGYDAIVKAREYTTGVITVTGSPVTDIHYDGFKSFAAHCDGLTPKVEINYYLDTDMDLWSLLIELWRPGRGVPTSYYGKLSVIYDAIGTPVQLFSMGNIVAGSFVRKWASINSRANAVEVRFKNAALDYDDDYIRRNAPEYEQGKELEQVRSFTLNGVTDKEIAAHHTVYELNSARRIIEKITFKAGIQAISVRVGELFNFQHDVIQYLEDTPGRVVSAASNSITLDRTVTLYPGATYKVQVQFSTTDALVEKTVQSVSVKTTTATLTLTTNWSTLPQKYDVVIFGEQSRYYKTYRCIALGTVDNLERSITGVTYDPEIYNTDRVLDEDLPDYPPTITGVWAHSVWKPGGLRHDAMPYVIVTWSVTATDQAWPYDVWLDDGVGEPELVKSTTRLIASIPTEYLEIHRTYTVIVALHNQGARDTGSNTATVTILPSWISPDDVTTFAGVYNSITHSVDFTWTEVAGGLLTFYDIRQDTIGSTWADAVEVLTRLSGDHASLYIDGSVSATIIYRIKATRGSFESDDDVSTSVAIATGSTTLPVPTGLTVSAETNYESETGMMFAYLNIGWDDQSELPYFSHYLVEIETISGAGGDMVYPATSNHLDPPCAAPRTFNVSVAAVDISNNATLLCTPVTQLVSLPTSSPDEPDFLTAHGRFFGVVLRWRYTEDRRDVVFFELAKRTDTSAPNESTDIFARIMALEGSYIDTIDSADTGTLYYYYIRTVTRTRQQSDWYPTTASVSAAKTQEPDFWPDTFSGTAPTSVTLINDALQELPDGTYGVTVTASWVNTPRAPTTVGFLGYHWRLVQSGSGAESTGITLALGKTSTDTITETVQAHQGKTYIMYVSTMDRYGHTSAETASAPVVASIDTTAPGAVTSLYAVGGALRVALSWTQRPNSERVSHYGLARTTDPSWGSAEYVKSIPHRIDLGSTSVLAYDHPPEAATTYYYCMVAVDRTGNASGASNVVQAQRGTAQLGIDIVESGTNKIFTSTNQAKLSGIFEGADVTNYADLRIANNILSASVVHIRRPGGGTAYFSGTNTGAIKIALPTTATQDNIVSFDVNVSDHVNDQSFTMHISGQIYPPSSTWYGTTAYISGTLGANNSVRFGIAPTTFCVWIGELSSTWNYCSVSVGNVRARLGPPTVDMWDDGWSISIVSSYDTVTRTISDAFLDAKAIRGQGVLATRNDVAWGTHITDRPVELTDGRITNGLDASGSVKKAVLWSLISNPPNFFDKNTDTTDNIIDSGLNNRFVTSNEKQGAARGFLGLDSYGTVNINVPLARLALAVGIRSSDGKLDLGNIGNGNIDNILDGASYKKVSASYVDASHRPIVLGLAQIADGLLSKYATASVISQSVPGEVGEYCVVVRTGHQTMKGGACLVIAVLRQKFTDSDTFQVGIQRDVYNGLSTRIYTGENSTSVERIRAAICVDTSPGTGQNDYVLWVKYNNTDGSCTFAEASISIINISK